MTAPLGRSRARRWCRCCDAVTNSQLRQAEERHWRRQLEREAEQEAREAEKELRQWLDDIGGFD